jgi:hypothetical protein
VLECAKPGILIRAAASNSCACLKQAQVQFWQKKARSFEILSLQVWGSHGGGAIPATDGVNKAEWTAISQGVWRGPSC